jgi:hypothetical protein
LEVGISHTRPVEVLKTLRPEQITEIANHLSRVHVRYAELLNQLIAEASEEKRQESERGKHRE